MSRGGLAKGILLAALFILLLATAASAGLIRRGGEQADGESLLPEAVTPGKEAKLTAGSFDVSGRFDTVESAGTTYIRFFAEGRG